LAKLRDGLTVEPEPPPPPSQLPETLPRRMAAGLVMASAVNDVTGTSVRTVATGKTATRFTPAGQALMEKMFSG
jgi:hypothetical protein